MSGYRLDLNKFCSYCRAEVTFCDVEMRDNPGWTLNLSQCMSYSQMCEVVGAHIKVHPCLLRFYRTTRHNLRGLPIPSDFKGILRDMAKPGWMKLFYQRLSIPVTKEEQQYKCFWIDPEYDTEVAMNLYPAKGGAVPDLLAEARLQIQRSGKLRLLEIINNKIVKIFADDTPLEKIRRGISTSLRVEEVPADEATLTQDEVLVPVAHFDAVTFCTFDTPFLVKVKHGDDYDKVQRLIRTKLGISPEQFGEYRLAAVVAGLPMYLTQRYKVDAQLLTNNSFWFGLDHPMRGQKRRHDH